VPTDPNPASAPGSLRLLTFNVRQLRDDASAVARVLRSSGADVVALQERPRGPMGGRRLRRLARSAGYDVAVAGGGSRTTAILTRGGIAVTGARGVALPARIGRTRRGLACADVGGVRIICVHLGLVPAERSRHVLRLLRLVGAAPGEAVIAGDLNEEPDGPTWRSLRLRLHDVGASAGPTFTAANPRRRIDAVLVTSGLAPGHAKVLDDEDARSASDHRPLLVDLHR
jgi:endonuclease/exonuclease/phosphatase family metal-dependent hydrolase